MDPVGIECISVTYPTSIDVWQYMQGGTHVEWSGAVGGSVRIDIYRDGKYYTDYLSSAINDGHAERTDYLHPSCHGSGSYQIRIEDTAGNTGWSDCFTIMCGGVGDIVITYPSGDPIWTYAGDDAYITWTSSNGEMVRIDIYSGGGIWLGTLVDWTLNDGRAEPPYPLDGSLQPGSYYLQVIDDEGQWGIGGDLTIQ